MSKRIYHVTNKGGSAHRLVRAGTAAAARSFLARDEYEVEVAPQETLVGLLGSGIKVEDAADLAPESAPAAEEGAAS